MWFDDYYNKINTFTVYYLKVANNKFNSILIKSNFIKLLFKINSY